MWAKDLVFYADSIINNARAMKRSGRASESAEVEEQAKEIEALAGSVVAAMQNEGMFCAVQIGGSSGPVINTKEPL